MTAHTRKGKGMYLMTSKKANHCVHCGKALRDFNKSKFCGICDGKERCRLINRSISIKAKGGIQNE